MLLCWVCSEPAFISPVVISALPTTLGLRGSSLFILLDSFGMRTVVYAMLLLLPFGSGLNYVQVLNELIGIEWSSNRTSRIVTEAQSEVGFWPV